MKVYGVRSDEAQRAWEVARETERAVREALAAATDEQDDEALVAAEAAHAAAVALARFLESVSQGRWASFLCDEIDKEDLAKAQADELQAHTAMEEARSCLLQEVAAAKVADAVAAEDAAKAALRALEAASLTAVAAASLISFRAQSRSSRSKPRSRRSASSITWLSPLPERAALTFTPRRTSSEIVSVVRTSDYGCIVA